MTSLVCDVVWLVSVTGECFSFRFFFFFFFFKQKTAYEIVDCDWSSDVCSSDLSFKSGIVNPELDANWKDRIDQYLEYIMTIREEYKNKYVWNVQGTMEKSKK